MTKHHSMSRRTALMAMGGLAAAPAVAASLAAIPRPLAAAAPMQGPARPPFYRFMLGEFEVTTLLDGYFAVDDLHSIFGQDQPAETVRELARENFLPEAELLNPFTPVLVNTGEKLVLFDTGNGPARRPMAANTVDAMRAAGYEPDQVDLIVLTHLHPDHIGGLMTDGEPTFPNATYIAGETEFGFWSQEERLSGPTEGTAKLVQSNVVPLKDKISFVGDGADVAGGITGMAAFGHTPGHMVYHIESGGKRLLLWGDTANHFVFSVQRPDWHVRFDMDKDAAAATRRRLFDMAAADRIPVTGYHMPFPAVGFIDKRGDEYRWVQASYQLDL